ncbi:Putative auto-transporter adhesin, head GIN domain [Hymenobacter mucosus]|uniref:Putative auto-transporter adhesin, head GIN domain n=2 Tax=Hymenobacter mucosus TaxID=1411120 RepID=A0A238VGJ9_9BACT|nr:Putative auto-transporter adhesin, head GIN domain [Hymenobacter mucosus]
MSRFEIWVQGNALPRLLCVGITSVAAMLWLSACQQDSEAGCFTSTGRVVTERREVLPFRTLTAYDNVRVSIVQDTTTYAEVEAGRNLQADIRLAVEGNELTIRNTSSCNWVRRYDTPREVTIHTPTLTDVFLRGQADVRTIGTFRADTLFAHLIGSGDFHLNLASRYLNMDQYELGDLHLEGETDVLVLTIGGNGSTYAAGLPANHIYLHTNFDSNGNAHFTPKQFLGGTHAGTGTVRYSGTPSNGLSLQITGKGKVAQE